MCVLHCGAPNWGPPVDAHRIGRKIFVVAVKAQRARDALAKSGRRRCGLRDGSRGSCRVGCRASDQHTVRAKVSWLFFIMRQPCAMTLNRTTTQARPPLVPSAMGKMGALTLIFTLACGGSTNEPTSEASAGASSEQSELDGMRVVCVEAPDAVAAVEDAAQRDFDYSRYVGTHVTNPQIYQMVLSMIANGTPPNQRAEILDAKAREVGLDDCSRSLFR